jgi:hypothetical protein
MWPSWDQRRSLAAGGAFRCVSAPLADGALRWDDWQAQPKPLSEHPMRVQVRIIVAMRTCALLKSVEIVCRQDEDHRASPARHLTTSFLG